MNIRFLLLALLGMPLIFGQLPDLARVDFTLQPPDNTGFEFTRSNASFNVPIKINEKDTYMFLGLNYNNVNLTFQDGETEFDKEDLNDFQILDLNIGYTFQMNDKWRFGARITPGISSNLRAGDIGFDDVVLSGDIVFIKDRKEDETARKPTRLILGITYSENRGFAFPLPFISYYRKFSPYFSYNVGIPKSNFQYHISDAHRLKAYAQLDGVTSNLQEGVLRDGTKIDRFNMSMVVTGLQYEYHFKKRLEFYLRGMYIATKDIELRDDRNNEIFGIETGRGVMFRTGLRVKI